MNLNLVRRFFKFTVPSIVSMWIFSLYSLVDGMFVAWGVGEHALTAVNLSLPFVSLVFTLGILLATGTSTVLSIALGQKDVERARNYFNQNLFVVIAATLLLAVLVLFNLDWVADFLGATGENHHLVKEYVGVIACFSVFFTVSYNLEVQVKADGAPHVSIIGVISCGLMNVVLDYIFVMHLHVGVWGGGPGHRAGPGHVHGGVCRLFSHPPLSPAVRPVQARPRRLPPHYPPGYRRRPQRALQRHGHLPVQPHHTACHRPRRLVSYTIISYVNTLVLNSVIGIAHGIQPLCSYHLGAEERPVCHKFLTYGIRLAACFAAGFFVLCQVLAGAVVGLFLQPDSALFASSVSALRLYSFAFLFVGFNVVISGFFTAMEHPIPSLTISFGRGLVLISGCLVALAFLFGANGIWLSPLVSESLCLLITLFFLIRYFRRVRREASGERDGIPDARPLD